MLQVALSSKSLLQQLIVSVCLCVSIRGLCLKPLAHATKRAMKATKRASLPNCKNFRNCRNRVPTMRSNVCRQCFKQQACLSGAQSSGNVKGNPGNAGNVKQGASKRRAGRRSGLKRSAKHALVVKKKWLDKILNGTKDWEIRGCSTQKRGWTHFAESQAGGKLVGRARLVNCKEVPTKDFMKHKKHHCVTDMKDVPYKRIFAWVVERAERFKKPFVYKHRTGAVIWVKVGRED